MPAPIDTYLITGFLGSGKTTLLNRLIRAFPPGHRLMVLMNEFGEIGIDGQLVQGPEELELLEINRGSVFCACAKRDFIKALAAIAGKIRPDALIIEATGSANPTDIRKDLNLFIFEGRFRFREQICLLDGESFLAAYKTFSAVEKQIAAATRFVLNKTDLASADDLAAVRKTIHAHHPDPVIQEATYARIDVAGWLKPGAPRRHSGEAAKGPTPQSIEQTMAELLSDPFGALAPPDPLASAVLGWSGRHRASWDAAARLFPPGILRIKGFLEIDGQIHLFSRAGTTHELTAWSRRPVPPHLLNRLMVIGPPSAVKELETRTAGEPHLQLVAQKDPFALKGN